jgi:hypothetical protein
MTALYKDGTVTLVQGSPVIVGNDTGWKVALIVGGTVFVEAEGGSPLPILPDDSDGANLHPITNKEMTAAIKWYVQLCHRARHVLQPAAVGQCGRPGALSAKAQ